MTYQVWKFPLKVVDTQEVVIPFGAHILTVQAQEGVPCLWALVDPTHGPAHHTIRIAGTGHPIPKPPLGKPLTYIGTFQLYAGGFVGHVFDLGT
jgi:hypothetical protein